MALLRNLAVLTAAFALLQFGGCSKTPEKAGDAFLASAQKAQNPKVREEREKKAYLKYLEALNWHAIKGQPVPVSLRVKVLNLTLGKLNRELSRFLENPEEANVEQINLWRGDFKKYLAGVTDKDILEGYSDFLISFANPEFLEIKEVEAVLKEAEALGIRAEQARAKLAEIQTRLADDLMSEAEKILRETQEGLKTRKNGAKDNLVLGEYKTLQALKHDPRNARALKALPVIRGLLLDTYSGYERFQENLDPDIDKYDIYLCIPKKTASAGTLALDVALWNLTASPILVNAADFSLVTDEGDTLRADGASRFNKITVDIKTDTTQSVLFRLPRGKKVNPRNLLFTTNEKISEKFFH